MDKTETQMTKKMYILLAMTSILCRVDIPILNDFKDKLRESTKMILSLVEAIVKPKSSPKSRSQIQNPKSKVQRKRNGTGADNIILQA